MEPVRRFCVLSGRGGGSWERVTSLTDFPALKSFARREPVSSAPSQCDTCRSKLGSCPHLYWRMRFCSLACMSAYQQRLSPQTNQKILMLEPNDFFQNQVKHCRSQAERAANKNDRDFWLNIALRWENLLQQRTPNPAAPKSAPRFRNGRSRFVKRRAA
jgi:hypothetical protein